MTSRRIDAGHNEVGSARAEADREAVTQKRDLRGVCPRGCWVALDPKNADFDGMRHDLTRQRPAGMILIASSGMTTIGAARHRWL